MSQYLLDTDWIVDVLHGQEPATQTLLELVSSGLALSMMTYGELYEGAYYARDLRLPWLAYGTFLQEKTSSL
jgi:predicted nucleic acid-binding protein